MGLLRFVCPVMEAVKNLQIVVIVTFVATEGTGLVTETLLEIIVS